MTEQPRQYSLGHRGGVDADTVDGMHREDLERYARFHGGGGGTANKESIPTSYTIWKDGSWYRAESNIKDGILLPNNLFSTLFNQVVVKLGTYGGDIFLKKGTHTATDLLFGMPWWDDGLGTIKLHGEGMFQTIIKVDSLFNTWGALQGLIAYGKSGIAPKVHQWIVEDLTFDGNYDGVDSGEVSQPVANAPALVALPQPFDQATAPTAPKELFHYFNRVRFYRPPGYVFQGAYNSQLTNCVFDQCGQPDKVALNYDIIGGGDWSYVKVFNSSYKGCRGNYVDFSATTDAKPCRTIFIANTAIDHILGGIYGLGERSIVSDNILINTSVGSGIGYDVGTHANNRIANSKVTNNILVNLVVDDAATIEVDGKARTATAVDLSGGAATLVVFHAEHNITLRRADLLYTEASSADAGITLEIGKESDRNYYYSGDSETDKAQWYTKKLTLLKTDVAAGDTVTFYSPGGKTGTGEIMLILDYY